MIDRKRKHATLTPDAESPGSKCKHRILTPDAGFNCSTKKDKTLAPDVGSPGDDPEKQLASPVKARRSVLRETFIGPDGSLYRAVVIPSPRRRKFKGPISLGPPVANGPISPGPLVANEPLPLLETAEIYAKYGEWYTEYVRSNAEFKEYLLSLPEEAFHDGLTDDDEEVSDYSSDSDSDVYA